MDKFTTSQVNLLNQIAKSENIADYDVVLREGASKGDGYLSHVQGIKIKDKKTTKELNLILKASPVFTEVYMKETFAREIYFYTQIVPTLKSFLKKINADDFFNITPKCYGIIPDKGKESLILDNLKYSGYKLWKRQIPITDDIARLVFSEYGKFHAVSLAFLDKFPEVHKKLVEPILQFPMARLEEDDEQFQDMMWEKYEKPLERDPKILEAFTKYMKENNSCNLYDVKPNKYSVILHGDAWINNILFKYEDQSNPNKPTSLKLIDFQMSRLGSSTFDLVGFFCICCTKNLFSNLNDYLKLYYDSLVEVLKRLGCDANELYPRKEFDQEWKNYRVHGIAISAIIMRQLLIENDEIVDNMNDLSFEDRQKEAKKEIKNQKELDQRLYDLIKFMVDNKWI